MAPFSLLRTLGTVDPKVGFPCPKSTPCQNSSLACSNPNCTIQIVHAVDRSRVDSVHEGTTSHQEAEGQAEHGSRTSRARPSHLPRLLSQRLHQTVRKVLHLPTQL